MTTIEPQETKVIRREFFNDKALKIWNRTPFPLRFYHTDRGIEVQGLQGLLDIRDIANPADIKMKEK